MTSRRTRPAVTATTLGTWLLKVSPRAGAVDELVRTRFARLESRCVRPSYRTELVEAGQPVLLWVSGGDARHVAGLHAAGITTGPTFDSTDGPAMPVRVRPLDEVVPRAELLAHPVLGQIEVLRMPAGSNPSYLDLEQYAALREAFPQIDRGVGPPSRTA